MSGSRLVSDMALANLAIPVAPHQGSAPATITLDGYAASDRAVRKMKADGQIPDDMKLRSSKYLNNLIEQDHRGVKLRIGPMLRFKWVQDRDDHDLRHRVA